ncbi:metallophosphoesterase family protein [Natronosalvus amylolyticus]|uniref:metallophosphoesterase family protein n=1 Tax=Natronosalvus amylolyticus TaxID=2961994 RepID=UPI0020CA246B|nr:metallophosphoesterase [Natronosalvus amylolyticus]
MKALIIGDIHLRTTGRNIVVDDLPVDGYDIVIAIGDVIDENIDHAKSAEAGERYETKGRAFFEALNERGKPVVAVPGNHDPLACTERLTEGLSNIEVLHKTTYEVPETITGTEDRLTIAGWGCETFDFTPAIPAPEYPTIAPAQFDSHEVTPGEIATYIETRTARYLAGIDDFETLEAAFIETPTGNSTTLQLFTERIELLEERFETVCEIMNQAQNRVVLCSHVSPYGVPFDKRSKHAHDGQYHFGSLALKLAILETAPLGVISGHTHQEGLTGTETSNGYTYLYNPGAPGVATLEVDANGTFITESVPIE